MRSRKVDSPFASNPFPTSSGSSAGGGGDRRLYADPGKPDPQKEPARTGLPGSFGVNITSPQGLGASVGESAAEANDFMTGLHDVIFGSTPKEGGEPQGGLPIVSDIARGVGRVPVAGSIVGIAGNTIGAAGNVASSALNAVGGALEHVPSFGVGTGQANEAQFNAVPDGPEKAAAQAQIAADPSVAGHVRYEFLREYMAKQQEVNPRLFPELSVAPGSLADDLSNLFAGLGVTGRPLSRAVAGAAKADGINRLQAIEAVHNGAVYTSDFLGGGGDRNNPTEEFAYQKWNSGEWTADEALDYLSAADAGLSHNPIVNIAGSVALDPTVWGSVGASGLAKLGLKGMGLAEGAALRAPGTARKANVLGKLAENQKVADVVRVIGGGYYKPLQHSALGSAAKVSRFIIDPLHFVGGGKAIGEALVDVSAESAPRVMAEAHGFAAHFDSLRDAQKLSPSLFEKMVEDDGIYTGNAVRRVLMRYHVASSIMLDKANAIKTLTHEELNHLAEGLTHAAPKDWVDLLKTELVRTREIGFDDIKKQQLARRMAVMYGENSAEEWMQHFAGKSDDYLSILHARTYGRATKNFLEAQGAAINQVGRKAADKMKLNRLILLNRTTLTSQGGEGLLKRIAEVADDAEAAALIREAQRQYPELAYIPIREENLTRSVEQFSNWLRNRIDDGVLPAQLTDDEIKGLPPTLFDFNETSNEVFTLGFRPTDDLISGLAFDGEGNLVGAFDPWVDHVATGTPGYRGSFATSHNIAGMPLVGSGVGKAIDYMEAGARTLKARTSGAMITEAARARFITRAMKSHDLTDADARLIFNGLVDAAGLHETTVRGLSVKNMWEAVDGLIPDHLRFGPTKMTRRDILNLVLDAYEGDLRFVGLSQKFTGRMKRMLGNTGSNFAGEFSERLYTMIRFKMNPLFQTQERIEPWVLNAWRGITPALGTKMNAADLLTMRQLNRLAETGLGHASDLDQAEFAAAAQIGQGLTDELGRAASASRWAQFSNVRGAKQLNMLRTMRASNGKAMRAIWDQNMPGEWDRFVEHFSQVAGRQIDDGEVAARILAQGSLDGDVIVGMVAKQGDGAAAFRKTIDRQEWHVPSNLGELKPLKLDDMAADLALPYKDGSKHATTVAGLRAALADSTSGITMQRVKDALALIGAHPDYIRRVENALDFHWDGFWRTVRDGYKLSNAEMAAMQDTFVGAAKLRGMTPVDYISQVFSPFVAGGKEAAIASLADDVSILRRPLKGGTPEMLVNQMTDVFWKHLDPSAQETLIASFQRELPGEINDAMVEGRTKASQELQKVYGEFKGATGAAAVAPTHHIDPLTGFARGRFVRQAEWDALAQRGKQLLDEINNAPVEPLPWLSDPEAYNRIADDLYNSIKDGPWGGSTRDAHTGQLVVSDAVYHGTTPQAAASIEKIGMRPGSNFTPNVTEAKKYSRAGRKFGEGPVFRTRRSNIGEGRTDDIFVPGQVIPPEQLEVLRTPTGEFEPVVPGSKVGYGPYTGAIGSGGQSDLPIADAVDPTKFRQAFDEFAAKNREELEKVGHQIGVFRNEDTGLVEFDVVYTVPEAADAEAIQTVVSQYQTGGWYDHWAGPNGDGIFRPVNRAAWTEEHSQRFSQAILDRINGGQVADPDVERAVQYFAKWAKGAMAEGITKSNPDAAKMLEQIAGIPTNNAVPYNLQHQLMVNQIGHSMRQSAEDAFRLQYFARNRTFLERSLNHPFFGIYPASYMWGKILPEVARFVAREPFGIRTGAVAYAGTDIAKSMAAQREFDPEFEETMEGLGHSSVGWLMGYMIPTLPWDVGAAAPTWARELADQGLSNQARVDAGEEPKPIDFGRPFTRIQDYISPFRPVEQLRRPAEEIGDFISGSKEEQKAGGGPRTFPVIGPFPNEVQRPTEAVQATELAPLLGNEVLSLQDVLAGR